MTLAQASSGYIGVAIGAGAALLGSIIGGLTSYLLGRQRIEHERKQWRLDQRRAAYTDALSAAQDFFHKSWDVFMDKRGSLQEAEVNFAELYGRVLNAYLFAPKAMRSKLDAIVLSGRELLENMAAQSPTEEKFEELRNKFLENIEVLVDQAWAELGLHEE